MKKVLFVCVVNAGCSQMAEAFFNQLAIPGSCGHVLIKENEGNFE